MNKTNKLLNSFKEFITRHPFFSWLIISIIFCLTLGGIGVLISIFTLFIAIGLYNKEKSKKEAINKLIMVKEANEYIDTIKNNKSLPILQSDGSIFLDKTESLFLKEGVDLRETRAVRHSSGAFGSVRVMKGVRVGKYGGSSKSSLEWSILDTGSLLLTSKKLLFMGDKENRTIPLKKIMAVETFLDAVQITVDGRSKALQFPVKNPYIWATALNIVKSAEDPTNLGDIKLDIQLK